MNEKGTEGTEGAEVGSYDFLLEKGRCGTGIVPVVVKRVAN